MTHPEPDVLAGLAMDSGDVDASVREHVAGCAACTGLVERLAGVRRTAGTADELVAPPDAVRDRVLAEIAGSPLRSPPRSSPSSPVVGAPAAYPSGWSASLRHWPSWWDSAWAGRR